MINSNGYWETKEITNHFNDKGLGIELGNYVLKNKYKSVLDLGCGTGYYVSLLKTLNIEYDAFDGNPFTKEISNGLGDVLDLSKDFELNKKYDLVMSLEVGEHIPKEFEDVFINNIIQHSKKKILLSWGIPKQPGEGHINCQTNDYIINKFEDKGFKYNKIESQEFRKHADAWWFKNTIMVFEK